LASLDDLTLEIDEIIAETGEPLAAEQLEVFLNVFDISKDAIKKRAARAWKRHQKNAEEDNDTLDVEAPLLDLSQPEEDISSQPAEVLGQIMVLERKLQNEKDKLRVANNKLRSALRAETVFTELKDALEATIQPLAPLATGAKVDKGKNAVRESLVMHLSDEHADQIVLPQHVNGLENYNIQVALRRAEVFVDTTLKFALKTLSNYQFKDLWVLAYGDHVNGEIHDSIKSSSFQNRFANVVAVGQMHAMMFRELAPHFENVYVVYVPGNHGRMSPKKDLVHGVFDNYDYLVAEIAAAHCQQIDNLEFVIPNSFSINVDIEGYTFNISHGDDVKSHSGIPFYGIERRNYKMSAIHAKAGKGIDYTVMGHFHQLGTSSSVIGETILNGSWKATDEYAYNSLAAVGRPMQLIHGVHEDHGVTWRLPVYLKTPGDENGPTRYKLNFAADTMNAIAETFR